MRKAEKRRIGRARQEQNLKDSIASGHQAAERDRQHREWRKQKAEEAKAKRDQDPGTQLLNAIFSNDHEKENA